MRFSPIPLAIKSGDLVFRFSNIARKCGIRQFNRFACGTGQHQIPLGIIHFSLDHDQTPVETAATGSSSTLFVCVPFTYGALSFAWDDASVKTAAAKGGVGKVQYADYEFFNVIGVYQKTTVVVEGE